MYQFLLNTSNINNNLSSQETSRPQLFSNAEIEVK